VKTIVHHPLYGRLTHDTATGKVTVQKGDLAERLTWLMRHQDELGTGYYPNAFLRACELLGVCGGELDVKISTKGESPPPGTVY